MKLFLFSLDFCLSKYPKPLDKKFPSQLCMLVAAATGGVDSGGSILMWWHHVHARKIQQKYYIDEGKKNKKEITTKLDQIIKITWSIY